MRGQIFLQRARNGLSPSTQIAVKLGRTERPPRFAGVSVRGPDRVAVWDIAFQIADGEYDFPGLRPEAGDRVVDIGANVGVFALWASHLGASVTAYEPGPETYQFLASNVQGRDVRPVHAAVVGDGVEEDTVTLYLHGDRSTRNTLVGHEIGTGQPLSDHAEVPAARISDVLNAPCDLLKIDCEGGEFGILRGASPDTLRQTRRVVLEFHRSVGDPDELLGAFTRAGFDISILEGHDSSASFGVMGGVRRGD